MDLTRAIHPATMAAIVAGGFAPVVMVFLDWPDGPLYVHSNVGNISFAGQTWGGLGQFGRVSTPEEMAGLAQSKAVLSLVGAPDEIDAYLDAPIRNRLGEIYFGVVSDRMGSQLVGDPFLIFSGYIDAMTDTVTADGGDVMRVLSIELANGPSQRLTASLYHTDEDQRRAFPDDTAGRLVINAEERLRSLTWPE